MHHVLAQTTSQTGVDSFGDAADQALTEIETLLAGFVGALPRLVIGLVVLAGFWGLGKLASRLLRPRLADLRDASVARMTTSMVNGAILAVGVFVFLSLVFPSVNASTILGGAGVLALAAGFAFQDIFENLMAGILLIIRSPFEVGDTVEVEGATGIIEAVTLRETTIRRFDRQQMVVPNSQVIKNAIRVQTHREQVRSSVLVGVGYDDDLQLAEDTAVEALRSVEGVLDDPSPQAFYVELAGSSINLDLRYFHGSGQHELRRVQSEVIKSIKTAFAEAGISIPFQIITLDAMDDIGDAVRAIAADRTGSRADAGASVG